MNKACRDGFKRTAPVGSFPANAFGLHDMSGNVYESVEDCLNWNHKGAPTDGRAVTTGPHYDDTIVRGGSWSSVLINLQLSRRLTHSKTRRESTTGLRIALDLD